MDYCGMPGRPDKGKTTREVTNVVAKVPKSLHTEFKLLSVIKGVSMDDVINQLIESWVKENKENGA